MADALNQLTKGAEMTAHSLVLYATRLQTLKQLTRQPYVGNKKTQSEHKQDVTLQLSEGVRLIASLCL